MKKIFHHQNEIFLINKNKFSFLKECLSDGFRLNFFPLNPFHGHIYVKGFFMHRYCHFEFLKNPIQRPFFLHIPYDSNCSIYKRISVSHFVFCKEISTIFKKNFLNRLNINYMNRLNLFGKKEVSRDFRQNFTVGVDCSFYRELHLVYLIVSSLLFSIILFLSRNPTKRIVLLACL